MSAFQFNSAVAQGEILNDVKAALSAGSAKELSRNFNSTVEIGFDGNKSNYSKTQAEFVLKDFFSKNAPAGFEYIHQGASREGLKYAIGKYNTANGSYRVYILIKQFKGTYLVDTIDFTKE